MLAATPSRPLFGIPNHIIQTELARLVHNVSRQQNVLGPDFFLHNGYNIRMKPSRRSLHNRYHCYDMETLSTLAVKLLMERAWPGSCVHSLPEGLLMDVAITTAGATFVDNIEAGLELKAATTCKVKKIYKNQTKVYQEKLTDLEKTPTNVMVCGLVLGTNHPSFSGCRFLAFTMDEIDYQDTLNGTFKADGQPLDYHPLKNNKPYTAGDRFNSFEQSLEACVTRARALEAQGPGRCVLGIWLKQAPCAQTRIEEFSRMVLVQSLDVRGFVFATQSLKAWL